MFCYQKNGRVILRTLVEVGEIQTHEKCSRAIKRNCVPSEPYGQYPLYMWYINYTIASIRHVMSLHDVPISFPPCILALFIAL
jgi:hypothetical protein